MRLKPGQQCSKLLPVRLPKAENFGGGPATFFKIFFNFMFMIWDSRQEDWQLFWLSFEHCGQLNLGQRKSTRAMNSGRSSLTTYTAMIAESENNINPAVGLMLGTLHYGDVIMGTIVSQITSLTIVYLTVYSDAYQRKHQSSVSLAFVWGIQREPVNSLHKWPVTRKCFHLMMWSWVGRI